MALLAKSPPAVRYLGPPVAHVLLLIAAVWSGHRVAIVLMEAALGVALHRGVGGVLAEFAGPFVQLVVSLAALVLLRRRWPDAAARPKHAFAVALALYVPLGYVASLHQEPRHMPRAYRWADGVWAYLPHSFVDARVGTNPLTRESNNAIGFRMPEWTEAKPAGVVRGVILGDSFAYGTGVRDDETLAVQLERRLNGSAAPGVRYQVLDLGIPGVNVRSYPRVYRAALRRLAPDFVVLCLTVPNDLSDWDRMDEREDRTRVSPFSLVAFAFGSRTAEVAWSATNLSTEPTPEAVALLRQQLAELARARAHPPAPPLIFFAYDNDNGVPKGLLARSVPDARYVPPDGHLAQWHIPGDGHPSAAGDAHFADQLSRAFFADPELRALRPAG